MEKLKMLLYGDIDMNIIDGSSIWITSIINTLLVNKDISIDLLLKKQISNYTVLNSINNLERVNLIDPFISNNNSKRLTPKDASIRLLEIYQSENYDSILVRGTEVCNEVCSKEELRDKLISYPLISINSCNIDEIDDEELKKIYYIYNNSKFTICQTTQAIKVLQNIVEDKSDEKIILLPPMIPSLNTSTNKSINKNNSLLYSGKISKYWNIDKILKASTKLINEDSTISLTVVGNKFNSDINHIKDDIVNNLENGENINWIAGVSRDKVLEIMKEHDIGIAWRSEEIDNDNSIEISTKVLEYSSYGIPVILNKTKLHEELFGKNYPLFIDGSENDFIEKVTLALYDSDIYNSASKIVQRAVKSFTFEEVYKSIHKKIWSFKKDKVNLLFVGHDFKFLEEFIDYCQGTNKYNIQKDIWKNHTNHDEHLSQEYLNWADIIFCEWGLGNVVWYSNNKLTHQKLIVRMHSQERLTKYYESFNVDNIDNVVTITPFMFEEVNRIMNIPREKIKMVYNYVDTNKFDTPKDIEAKYNLGMIGVCPKIKRMDRAIDIFEELYKIDNNYKLYIKGKMPKEYPWLMKREDEKEFYVRVFEKINNSICKDSIYFEGYGNDVSKWLSKVGYILSTSDREGSHVSVAEGMASGCIPVIFNWEGSSTIYEEKYIVSSTSEAVQLILNNTNKVGCLEVKYYAVNNFENKKVFYELEYLF